MAKCGFCMKKKGKRYCSPLDKVICPICCAENRLKNIDCDDGCRFLEGVAFQKDRADEKKYSELMSRVGHGQFDDIFQNEDAAEVAYDIETLVLDIYVTRKVTITDTILYNAYKNVYAIHFEKEDLPDTLLDECSRLLLEQFETHFGFWSSKLEEEMIGKIYLRLMISLKNMSGGRMGNYGYLNYLKNNLNEPLPDRDVIIEDKFGNKSQQRY
jgi:hypothetical protein